MKYKLLLLLFVHTLHADQFSFLWYNDVFAGRDRHFTNGIGVSWLDNTFENKENNISNGYSTLMFDIANAIPPVTMDESRQHNAGISLTQIIMTPTDTRISTPQYDDMAYAGYLALASYLFEWDSASFDERRIELGVVGEESCAEWLQNTTHKIIGNTEPKGWETQIGTELTINLLLRHGQKSWQHHYENGLNADLFTHFGIQAGNFITDAFAGTIFRFGENYIENFNVNYPYLKEEASLLQSYKKHEGIGWSCDVGINGELLGYSYILDRSKKEGYQVNKSGFSAALYTGASLYYEGQKLTFFYQSQPSYIEGKNEIDTIGGFKFTYQF
ncbi:MAG: lipid A deacylase LpxR family protein [Sulfuricurvum sp.]|jgi:hypothetical protein